MATRAPPDYYAILGIPETATARQIRDAYKRAALKTHPDRVSADSPDHAERTRKFQLVNDAYYTLSDETRRRGYDNQRKKFPSSQSPQGGDANDADDMPNFASADFGSAYTWARDFFFGKSGPAGDQAREQAEDQQFGDMFEEMLREEGMAEPGTNRPTRAFWRIVGGVSGGALGFIVANVPGMVAGAVMGNQLGAIRDTKGKSVYAVYQDLPPDDKAKLLSQLATKVFSHATGI